MTYLFIHDVWLWIGFGIDLDHASIVRKHAWYTERIHENRVLLILYNYGI